MIHVLFFVRYLGCPTMTLRGGVGWCRSELDPKSLQFSTSIDPTEQIQIWFDKDRSLDVGEHLQLSRLVMVTITQSPLKATFPLLGLEIL